MTTIVSGLIATALVSVSASAEPGFWPPTSEKLPAAVAQAARKSFQITVAGGMPKSFSREEALKVLATRKELVAAGELSKAEEALIVDQFVACSLSNYVDCKMQLEFLRSTAFFVDGELTTVLHAIRGPLQAAIQVPEASGKSRGEKIQLLARTVFRLAIELRPGQLGVLHLRMNKALYEGLEAIVDGAEIPKPFDVVTLAGLRDEGNWSLKSADKRPVSGTSVFISGFPAVTQDREKLASVPNADGGRRVTIGKVLSMADSLKRQQRDPKDVPQAILDFLERTQLMTDADANIGLSGAPMLNAAGEVVGIFGQGLPHSSEYSANKMAFGVRFDIWRELTRKR